MSFPSSHSIPTLLAPSPPLWVLYCSKKITSKSFHFGWSPTSMGFAYIVSSLKLNYSLYLRVTFHIIDHMSISIMYLDLGRKRRLEPKIVHVLLCCFGTKLFIALFSCNLSVYMYISGVLIIDYNYIIIFMLQNPSLMMQVWTCLECQGFHHRPHYTHLYQRQAYQD